MRRSRSRTHPRRGPRIDRAAAIVAAAGTGTRAREGATSTSPKQFALLRGRPLLEWALDCLSECAPVIIAAPPDDADRVREIAPSATIVAGGETRQASVRNALTAVDTRLVVVHDAARPLATPELVKRVLDGVRFADGAVPAIRLDDTIKMVDDGVVVRTLDRSSIWRVQTPQAFHTEALISAHERAAMEAFSATDDAQLLEHYGMSVSVVEGDVANVKVTHPQDFLIADALMTRT